MPLDGNVTLPLPEMMHSLAIESPPAQAGEPGADAALSASAQMDPEAVTRPVSNRITPPMPAKAARLQTSNLDLPCSERAGPIGVADDRRNDVRPGRGVDVRHRLRAGVGCRAVAEVPVIREGCTGQVGDR